MRSEGHYWRMTTQAEDEGRIPEVTLGWRLQMAAGGMKSQDIADALGVSRSTCARWMHDRGAAPKRAYVLQWAMITGVDAHWLEWGVPAPAGPSDGHRGAGPITSR